MIKKGHSFPTKFGFTKSSGKVQVVASYNRKPASKPAPAAKGSSTSKKC